MHTVDDCKNMLEEATKVHAERLKKTEAAWEDKCVSLKLELESKAEHHAAVLVTHVADACWLDDSG